jgi:hypothetical protein
MTDNSVYSQAKIEYTNQLIDVLKDRLYDGLYEIYVNSKKSTKKFRSDLENIIKWNQEMIEIERTKIIEKSKCEYIDDLITAVYISHTRILTSIGISSIKKVNLVVPKTVNFIHKCYINIARELWKNPNLFDNRTNSSEYQKNIRIIENIIKYSIEFTIRSSLPVRDILKNQLLINNDDLLKSNLESNPEPEPESNPDPEPEPKPKPKVVSNIYGKEDQIYDNERIIISDDEEDVIKSVINKDQKKEQESYETIIDEINNYTNDETNKDNSDNIDMIDDNAVVVNNYNELDLLTNMDNGTKMIDDGTKMIDDDTKMIDDDTKIIDDDTKIIYDLENKKSTEIKDIKKINVPFEINEHELDDDVETIDGILQDIEKLNNDDNDYTLFE